MISLPLPLSTSVGDKLATLKTLKAETSVVLETPCLHDTSEKSILRKRVEMEGQRDTKRQRVKWGDLKLEIEKSAQPDRREGKKQ